MKQKPEHSGFCFFCVPCMTAYPGGESPHFPPARLPGTVLVRSALFFPLKVHLYYVCQVNNLLFNPWNPYLLLTLVDPTYAITLFVQYKPDATFILFYLPKAYGGYFLVWRRQELAGSNGCCSEAEFRGGRKQSRCCDTGKPDNGQFPVG